MDILFELLLRSKAPRSKSYSMNDILKSRDTARRETKGGSRVNM